MEKIKLSDILKKGAKLNARKIKLKELRKFLKKYDKANEEYFKSVELRKQSNPELWNKTIEI